MDDLVSIEEGTKDYEMLQNRNLISGAIEYIKNFGREEESVTKRFDPNKDEYEIFEELSTLNKPSTAELEWLESFTRKKVEEAATEYGVGLTEAEHALAQLVEQLSQMKAREYMALDKYEQNRFLLLVIVGIYIQMKSGLGFIFTFDGSDDYFLQFFTPRQDYVFALRFKTRYKFSWKNIEYTLYAKSFTDSYTKDFTDPTSYDWLGLGKYLSDLFLEMRKEIVGILTTHLNAVQHECHDLNELTDLIDTADHYRKRCFDENLKTNRERFNKKTFTQADDLIVKINFFKQGLGELGYYIMDGENISKYVPGMNDDVKISTLGFGVQYTVIPSIYNSLREISFVVIGNMFAICYSGLTLKTNVLFGLETLWKMDMGKLVQDFEPFFQKYKMNQEKINQLMDIEFFM